PYYQNKQTYKHFFFSSRRRHTRSKRDWSSDVCSSDLERYQPNAAQAEHRRQPIVDRGPPAQQRPVEKRHQNAIDRGEKGVFPRRSEERRVGKECRSRYWSEARTDTISR